MTTNCDKYKEGKSRGKCKTLKGGDLYNTNCWEGFSEEVTSIRRHTGNSNEEDPEEGELAVLRKLKQGSVRRDRGGVGWDWTSTTSH